MAILRRKVIVIGLVFSFALTTIAIFATQNSGPYGFLSGARRVSTGLSADKTEMGYLVRGIQATGIVYHTYKSPRPMAAVLEECRSELLPKGWLESRSPRNAKMIQFRHPISPDRQVKVFVWDGSVEIEVTFPITVLDQLMYWSGIRD